ncbi:hypothetical protein C8A01DRAFT_35120 [Parachaetomium inaequale]|uniref:Uncharacterized protein n=1 Tax=Parachaetomium inaequale TaxID=2588326 RepID=A0AAN6PKR5_9PEZI|nr:hypothetical protein C8A01DRAFT_35120 [Parachaetomium inaequale]
MPAQTKKYVTLSKPGDWLDWYDALLDLAREYDLEDLVDIEKRKPVSEILLQKPERPNPLALFPSLLDTLPIDALKQVIALPKCGENGAAAEPPQRTFIRNQAIEDDALVHLTSAQAAGWRTRLSMHTMREREWRSQRHKVLALRRWIDKHVDPLFAYRTRGVEGVREAVQALRRTFSPMEEELRVYHEYDEITGKAGPALEVNEWFRQWRLAYDRSSRYRYLDASDTLAKLEFLKAAGKYAPEWADRRIVGVRCPEAYGDREKRLADLIDDFHYLLQYASKRRTKDEENGLYECPCQSDLVLVYHKPENCWCVRAALGEQHPNRRFTKSRLNNIREALQGPQWSWLVSVVRVGGV